MSKLVGDQIMSSSDPSQNGEKGSRLVHGWASAGADEAERVTVAIPSGVDDANALRALIEEMSLAAGIEFSDLLAAVKKADQDHIADQPAGKTGRPKDRQEWLDDTGFDFPKLARLVAVRRAVYPGKGSYARACREAVLAARRSAGKHRPSEAELGRLAEKLRQAHRTR